MDQTNIEAASLGKMDKVIRHKIKEHLFFGGTNCLIMLLPLFLTEDEYLTQFKQQYILFCAKAGVYFSFLHFIAFKASQKLLNRFEVKDKITELKGEFLIYVLFLFITPFVFLENPSFIESFALILLNFEICAVRFLPKLLKEVFALLKNKIEKNTCNGNR